MTGSLAIVACLVLGLAFAGPAAAQGTLYPCSIPSDILQEFQKLDFPNDMAMTARERAEESRKIFDALFAKYPDNFFVQRRYQDYERNTIRAARGDFDPLIKEYQALLAKHPDDPRYLYLYARALYDTKPQEAIRYHEKALQVAPNFPWPHLQLATIYGSGARDLAKRQAHLEAFMKMCPSSLEIYKYFGEMENKEFLRQSAEQLRKLIGGRTDSDALQAYVSLWTVEFRGASPSEYKQVRERQAADLARLRQLNLENNLAWYETLNAGYKTLGDAQGQNWVEDQLLQHFPQSSTTFMLVWQRWYRENPYPPEGTPVEKREAYNKKLLSATTEWIRLWPRSTLVWMTRFQVLTQLKDVSDADVEAAADKLMAAEGDSPDVIMPASMSMAVAAEFVKRGIRLASVPQLVESGIEQTRKQTQQAAHAAGMPPEVQQMMSDMMNAIRWHGWTILVDDYLKTNQADKTRDILVKMGAFLSEHKPDESAKPQAKRIYAAESRTYWEKMASLAEAQNRKMDAMGYYLNALDIPQQPFQETGQQDETASKARQLWKTLGGTDEGWSVWASEHMPPAAPEGGGAAWSKLNKPLPDFSLPDLTGHTWRLQDLKGKVTFLNVWATWCGPCQAEMPFVEKLYEKMKDDPHVLVLSLNIDDNPGLIEPFLRKSHYTFPIIPASSLFVQIDQFMAIPRNWIVDADGVLRREQQGFDSKDEEWLKNTTQTIEEVRNRKQPISVSSRSLPPPRDR